MSSSLRLWECLTTVSCAQLSLFSSHKMKKKIEKFRVLLILLVDQTDIILNRGKIKTHLKNVYQFFLTMQISCKDKIGFNLIL